MTRENVARLPTGEKFSNPVPEPDLTPDKMIARAIAMRDLLRANRVEAAKKGAYSLELHKAFSDAGFYRILQPRMFGGYEFDLDVFFKVMVEICRGDPGIGWCLTFQVAHTLPLVSHFPQHVVRDIFAKVPEFIAPQSAFPRGVATEVEGGYRVTGLWGYSSGTPFSTHFMGTALVHQDSGTPKMIVVLIPREDYTILDDWGGGATMALGASGSNTVELKDVFVPKDYTTDWNWIDFNDPEGTPGSALTGNPLYSGNAACLYHGEIACTQVGAARAALDEFERIITTKKRLHPPQVLRYLHIDSQRVFGEATQMVDAAETIMVGAARDFMTLVKQGANGGRQPTLEEYLRLGGVMYSAVRLSWEAGELMFRSVGSSVTRVGEPLQDYFLTLAMQRTQAREFGDLQALAVAKTHFGLMNEPVDGLVTEIATKYVRPH